MLGRNVPAFVTLNAGLPLQVAAQYPDWNEFVAPIVDTGRVNVEQFDIAAPEPGFVILGPEVVWVNRTVTA